MKKIVLTLVTLSILNAISLEALEPSYSQRIERMNLCNQRIKEFEMWQDHSIWMQGYIAGIHYSLFGDCFDMCMYK